MYMLCLYYLDTGTRPMLSTSIRSGAAGRERQRDQLRFDARPEARPLARVDQFEQFVAMR